MIDSVNDDGDGVARHNNRVIFVRGAVPGDRVLAKITKTKKSYAQANVETIIKASTDRVEPPCHYAQICGGCTVQQIEYDQQLALKSQLVEDALTRIGKQSGYKLKPILGMTFPYYYRNKMIYNVAKIAKKIAFGFYEKGTHKLIAIEECMIHNPHNMTILETVRNWVNKQRLSAYDAKRHQGVLRHIMIRNNLAGQYMLGLVINDRQLAGSQSLVAAIKTNHPEVVSLVVNINRRRGATILGDKYQTLYGQDHIIDIIGDLQYKISMASFFQVNPQQTAKLYDVAEKYAQLTGKETVWDIYSGAGTISLQLAKSAKHVYGNEIVDQAIVDAVDNAKRNQIDNVSFIQGAAETIVPTWTQKNQKPQVVVLDPPRKGADPAVLDAIVKLSPRHIVYISCKPSTMARDILHLSQNGYHLKEVTPVDMFGHSMHVECVVLMSRVKK